MTTSTSTRRRKERNEHFGDPDFRGLGNILCGICGEPTASHDYIGPCRTLRGGRITVSSRQRLPASPRSDQNK
jgi:hypothetical protein